MFLVFLFYVVHDWLYFKVWNDNDLSVDFVFNSF